MTQSLTGITSLPYVIDNRRHMLADVLWDLLGRHHDSNRALRLFESASAAALEFLKTFEDYILGGRLLKSSDFNKAMRYLARESSSRAKA
ncbi:MAG TPA: hypothetical protein VF173_13915 [Thermoanaerobaculia bacterium]|nr:hypothetical protein [Thermoanaerobaculia bacterium]